MRWVCLHFQVTNSPFNEEQVQLLNQLFPTLTESQKLWLSGYLAAGQSTEATDVNAPVAQGATESQAITQQSSQTPAREVTVLYGSQTGNAQTLAEELTQKLQEKNIEVTVSSLDDFKPKNIKKVQDLLILTSTHGEGEPPDNALTFYEFLYSKRAPELEDVRFSILSLGDTSYEFFCQTGKDFDQRLEELGGTRLYPRVDCDLDFEEPSAEWFEGVLNELVQSKQSNTEVGSTEGMISAPSNTSESVYTKKNPFRAEILENLNLNGRGSNKETRHLELDLEGSQLSFEPGDAVGIYPENDPVLVDNFIVEMNWNPEELITVSKDGEQQVLRDALTSTYEITNITKPLLEKLAQLTNHEELYSLLESDKSEELKAYIYGRDLIDLAREFGPWEVSANDFVQNLRKLPPRLYSIASSLTANPDEVHLTIGALRYDAHGRARTGVCSGQCAERLQPGDSLPIYIQKNSNFKLPDTLDTPVIMIGAGTGVAPYRAFLEEWEENDAEGDTWLFFGEQHFVTDFLYQIEWQKWLKEGVLTKMDVAFSRDTEEKVYVQHRMLEKGKELYQWIQAGAYVYVCGDEKYMAKDVHSALLTIFEREGGMSEAEAEVYLADMRSHKRYQRDVY